MTVRVEVCRALFAGLLFLVINADVAAQSPAVQGNWSGANLMLHHIEQHGRSAKVDRNRYWDAALAAMAGLDRRDFVPPDQKDHAYEDRPLPIGFDQTISDPFIVAYMTSLLKIDKADAVLEIGTGSGYQAAVLASVSRAVWTIEIVEPLARRAVETFGNMGFHNIHFRSGDGYDGWPDAAPFDAIIVTAGAPYVPVPLLKQLKPAGRMVIPVGKGFWDEQLILVTKDRKGKVTQKPLGAVMFVDFTGKVRKPDR